MQSKEYTILEENKEGNFIIVKAGNKWTNKRNILQYEGIRIRIPSQAREGKIKFAIMSIEKGKEFDRYTLRLHAHGKKVKEEEICSTKETDCYICECGDIETTLNVEKDLLKRWTQLSGREIDEAFGKIKMGATYNLIMALPRTITIEKEKVIVKRNESTKIDSMNVCNTLLEDKYPK